MTKPRRTALQKARDGDFGLTGPRPKEKRLGPRPYFDRKRVRSTWIKVRCSPYEKERLDAWAAQVGGLSFAIRELLKAAGALKGRGLTADTLEALASAARAEEERRAANGDSST